MFEESKRDVSCFMFERERKRRERGARKFLTRGLKEI